VHYVHMLLACAASVAYAQDPFEIHIYEYEPLGRGSFTYEAHLNYDLQGTRSFDGSVAPTRHQFHFTSEVTSGLSDQFAVGLMLLTAVRPDQSLEYGGWRILPHFYAPRSWHLPFDFGWLPNSRFRIQLTKKTRGESRSGPSSRSTLADWSLTPIPSSNTHFAVLE